MITVPKFIAKASDPRFPPAPLPLIGKLNGEARDVLNMRIVSVNAVNASGLYLIVIKAVSP
jgi:hypothetical protein